MLDQFHTMAYKFISEITINTYLSEITYKVINGLHSKILHGQRENKRKYHDKTISFNQLFCLTIHLCCFNMKIFFRLNTLILVVVDTMKMKHLQYTLDACFRQFCISTVSKTMLQAFIPSSALGDKKHPSNARKRKKKKGCSFETTCTIISILNRINESADFFNMSVS